MREMINMKKYIRPLIIVTSLLLISSVFAGNLSEKIDIPAGTEKKGESSEFKDIETKELFRNVKFIFPVITPVLSVSPHFFADRFIPVSINPLPRSSALSCTFFNHSPPAVI